MSEEKIHGIEKRKALAKDALNSVNAAELHKLYEKAEDELQVMINGLNVMCRNDKLSAVRDGDGAVKAIRDIAIAAIGLAETVVNSKGVPRK